MTLPIRIALFFFAFSVNAAMACRCAPFPPTITTYRAIAEWRVNQTPVIFEGKVDSLKVAGWPIKPVAGERVSIIPRVTVSFTAVHVYRGETPTALVVETGLGGGDCGFAFVPGESYLVFAGKEENGNLSTSICSGTALLEDAGVPLRLLRREAPSAADLMDPRENVSRPREPAHQICGKITAPAGIKLSSVEVAFWRAGQEDTAAFQYDMATVQPDGSYCMDYLRPGKYLIGASQEEESESDRRYVSYYPGVIKRSEATAVLVQAKGKTLRADFPLLSQPLFEVHGYLRGAPENSTQTIKVMLLSAVLDQFHAVEPADLGPHGIFELEGIPAGRYTIFAMTQSDDGLLTFLSEGNEIDVVENIEGFRLDYFAKK